MIIIILNNFAEAWRVDGALVEGAEGAVEERWAPVSGDEVVAAID